MCVCVCVCVRVKESVGKCSWRDRKGRERGRKGEKRDLMAPSEMRTPLYMYHDNVRVVESRQQADL